MSNAVRAVGFLACLVCNFRNVQAIEADDLLLFNWGSLTIEPQLSIEEEYHDNIFYQSRNQETDLISTLSPGVTLLWGRRSENHIILDYALSQHFYAERTDLDDDEHLIELNTLFEGDRLSLTGRDRIQILSSPIGGETRILDPETGDRPLTGEGENIERLTIYDNYTLRYNVSEKTGLYARGTHNSYDFERGVRFFDVQTFSGAAGFAHKPFAKIDFFGEVVYGRTSSSPNTPSPDFADLTFIGGGAGARGSFTSKIDGTLRLGYEAREYEDGSGKSSSPVVNLALNYRYSTKTSVALNYYRRQDVSVQFEQQSYAADVVSLQLTQALGRQGKWRASLGGYYARYDYEPSAFNPRDRDYNRYSINFSLAYQIQLWLSTSLGFERSQFIGGSSTVSSYDVNRATLRVSVGY